MMTKRLGKMSIAAICGLTFMLTVFGSALAADTIKIGVAGPHSGDLASYACQR